MAKRYRWSDGKLHSRPQRTAAQLGTAVRRKAARRKTAVLDRNPLYDPSQQLSGSRLAKAADALVGLEFNPQRKALQAESAQAERQGGAVQSRASDYFMQLAQAERGNVERSTAVGNLLQQRIGTIGQESTQALDQTQAKAQEVLGADREVRGAGLEGGSTALAEEIAAARARSAASTQAASQDAATMTGNYGNLADLSRQARELRGGEIVGQAGNATSARLADVASRRAALEASVGGKRTEHLLGLRQSGFENAATAVGLDIDQAELQAQTQQGIREASLAKAKLRSTNRQNRARNRLTAKQIRATRRGQSLSASTQRRGQDVSLQTQIRGQNISAAQRAADRASRERVAKARRTGTKLESADARKVKTGIANALADVQSVKPKNAAKWLRKQGAPGIVIKATLERNSGGLNYDTAQELRRLGIRVPKSWVRGGSNYNKGNVPG